jgi:hypothetical protein
MSNSIKMQSFQVPRIQNQSNLTQFGSLNFNSNFVPNLKNSNEEMCSLFNYMHVHILFGNFCARKGHLLI